MEQDFNRRIDALIIEGRWAEARALLEPALRDMPRDWKAFRENEEELTIAFWDEEEFLAYCDHHAARLNKTTLWVQGSYSRAWYQLAVVESRQERFEEALFAVDCGLELEPGHPQLWCERGYLLGRLKRHEEALQSYVRAASVRDWAPESHVARALRGQGVQLVDLDRLGEAEAALRRSLEMEPESEVAANELKYINSLRSRRQAEEEEIPWFLHSLVNPPTDRLTIQLLALVEDLPSIPGPQTVGSDNYSRIMHAFMERGWTGFEEEFDRIVPRSRADYAEVKRDLLCEPMFSVKAHRNMAELVADVKTIDEILGGEGEERRKR